MPLQRLATRSDPLQIGLTRPCLYGRGACAALIKTNLTEWNGDGEFFASLAAACTRVHAANVDYNPT